MSKMYNKYLELKKENSEKMYLFKCGNFYIFLADDCDRINEFIVLKKTKFSNECMKCGFPISVLDDYLRVFRNQNLPIEMVDDISDNKVDDKITKMIDDIDIDNITPKEALIFLLKLKGKINKK